MSRIIRVLFVEGYPREVESARHFFQIALARYGVGVTFRMMTSIPERAPGYDLVSLGEIVDQGEVARLLSERPILRQNLAEVPYLNVHAPVNASVIASYERMFQGRGVHFHDKGQFSVMRAMDTFWEFEELGLVQSLAAKDVVGASIR